MISNFLRRGGRANCLSACIRPFDLSCDLTDESWVGLGSEHVQSFVASKNNGWTANQVWGFEEIDGKRMYVRHVVVRKGEDWKQARLVYDWRGSAAQESAEDGLAYDE